jgi:tetratricopeptide (TPR) repeat protein
MDGANPHLLTIQPMFPYFLKTKLAQADGAFREALQLGFKNHYQNLAMSYFQLIQSKEPKKKEMGLTFLKLEYENLYQALEIALDFQDQLSPMLIFGGLMSYLDLTKQKKEELSLAEAVYVKLKAYPPDKRTQEFELQLTGMLDAISRGYMEKKEYLKAREYLHEIVERGQLAGMVPDQFKSAILGGSYNNLGAVAQELREYDEARANYQQALQIFIQFNDRFSQAGTYHNLGAVAEELREYDEARANYQQALQIKVQFNDRYEQASTYHQLGIVAQKLREYDEARANYQQALKIYVEFNDCYEQADTYHNLGAVAEELREYDEARTNYQQALQIFVQFNDRFSQASTYHQLGIVAQKLREYDEARANYQQALQIFVEFNDRYEQASTYGQLGLLAEAEKQPEEAIQQLVKALEIFGEFQDNHSAAMTIQNLKRIYESHPSPQFLTQIAQCLNRSETEVLQLFEAGVTA